jgi:hypothetical protein
LSTFPARIHRPASFAERLFIYGVLAFGIVAWRPWRQALLGWLAVTVTSPPVQQSAGVLALAVLASAGVSHVPVFVDEANNVLSACLLAHGSVVYRDFFSHHFPLPYYLLASLGDPAACSVLAARHLGTIAVTVAALMFTLVTRNRLAPAALLVMTLASSSYYAQMYLAETVLSVGLILSLALVTDRAQALPGPVAFALRLIALLTLASSSQIGLMMAGVLGPLMLLQARGQRRAVLVAGIAALAVWPVFFALHGAFRAFVDQAFLFNTQIYGKYLDFHLLDPVALLWQTLSFGRHRFSFVVDWLAGQNADTTVATFAVGFELALLLLLVGLVAARRGESFFRLALVALLPICVARDGFHLAPFVTLASFGAAQLLPGLLERSRLAQAGAAIAVVLALRLYFFALPTDLAATDELATSLEPDALVQKYAPPGAPILYLPMSPDGYLAADRPPGSFYSFFLPWEAEIPGAEERVIADIEARQVPVIVLDQETPVWDKYKFRDYAPKLYTHITRTYRPQDDADARKARVFVRAAP